MTSRMPPKPGTVTFRRPRRSSDISAWSIASEVGYTLEQAPLTPRLVIAGAGSGKTATVAALCATLRDKSRYFINVSAGGFSGEVSEREAREAIALT